MSLQSSEDDTVLKQIEEEGINNAKDLVKKMYDIWKEFGINTDQKSHRAKVVWNHVKNLLQDIYDEENIFYEEIKERIKNYTSKIKELSSILAVAPNEPQGSLVKIEEILREELDSLIQLKHKRVKKYQDLKKEELNYCKILNLQERQLAFNAGVPSEDDLADYEQHIKLLKEGKEKRQKEFCLIKRELSVIFESTELEPESTLERDILSAKETLPLTDETFKALDDIINRALKRKEELENRRIALVDKLTVLWQRLKFDEDLRDFLSKHANSCLSTIKSLERELERCENIKKQNIGKFVTDLRVELEDLWNTCHVSQPDRDLFYYFFATDISDEVLEAHEKEVCKWKKYYSKVEPILDKIEKRQHLWDMMLVFENKAADPNRFNNRKGNLLKEERERKKLQKELPALENDIFTDIEEFEAENESAFFYKGEDFKSFVTNQWAKRNNQKENEKIARQNKHFSQLKIEAAFGTPAKRPLMTTPKTAPSKLFKSTVGTPCTPASSVSRAGPSTVGKIAIKSSRLLLSRPNYIQKKDQNVLKDKNKLTTLKANTVSPNGTTYTDFALEMNSPARYNFRSSVLVTKKPGGTRTSQTDKNRSKIKSAAKSLRKSSANKSKTSTNLTPARGKLGLPFLI